MKGEKGGPGMIGPMVSLILFLTHSLVYESYLCIYRESKVMME